MIDDMLLTLIGCLSWFKSVCEKNGEIPARLNVEGWVIRISRTQPETLSSLFSSLQPFFPLSNKLFFLFSIFP